MAYPGCNQVASLFLCAVIAAQVTPALSATRIDSTFAPQLNPISGYCGSLVQPGGKVFVANVSSDWLGHEIKDITVNGQPLRGFMRLNANGTIDQSFSRSVSSRSWFSAIATAPDGSAIVSGYYNSPTLSKYGLFRLHPNGNYDTNFVAEFDSIPSRLSLQADGKILLQRWNYQSNYSSIVRLNTNGTIDDTFVYGGGSTSTIPNITIPLATGEILVGLHPRTPPQQRFGVPTPTFIRLTTNGSVDSTFQSPFLGEVWDFTMLPDGGVAFVVHGSGYSLHRINLDGVVDSNFKFTFPNSWYGRITAQSDGRVIAAASDPSVPTMRINTDGTIDSTFAATNLSGVYSVGVTADDKIVVGGYIPDPEWQYIPLLRLNADGTRDRFYRAHIREAAVPGYISTQPPGKTLVAGAINRVEGLSRHLLARLNSSGRLDRSYSPNLPFFDYWEVHFNSRGDVLFTSYPSSCVVDVNGSARWINGEFATAIENDGSVLTVSDVIRRVNVNGTLDKEIPLNSPNSLVSVTPLSSGKLLAIQSVGYTIARVLRLNHNGTVDSTFSCQQQVGYVFYEQPDGKVYVGVDGQNYTSLARLNTDGSLDSTFTWPFHDPATLSAVTVDARSRVLVAEAVPGNSYGSVVRLFANGAIDTSFKVQTDGYVSSIALLPDGRLVLGGTFTRVNGIPKSNFACVYPDQIAGPLTSVPSP